MNFDDVKERIRDAVDIVDLVGQYVPLRRQGSSYTGRCPWHDDSRPSLQVNPQRQTFKCWVCDIGGDIFSFIMKIENVEFREALEILSEKTGIPLPVFNGKENEDRSFNIDKKAMRTAAGYVAELYHRTLIYSPEGEAAKHYLADRHITEESIVRFQLGYAPMQNRFLADKVKANPDRLKVLEVIGNWKNNKDFFGGRLIFPIRDERGNTVAFGGRLIPHSPLSRDEWHKDRKYLNTSETPLFSKHKILYGLDLAKQKIKEQRRVIIMEGYTDVITAHQFGFTESVAVLGTALGREHIKLLNRMGAEKIILMLDGDKAGQSKASSDTVLSDFVAEGADMSVLTLPENLDPSEYLEKYGGEALNELLQTSAVGALEHMIRIKTQGIDIKNNIAAASKAWEGILTILAHTPLPKSPTDPIGFRIEQTLQTLAVKFDRDIADLRKRFHAARRQSAAPPVSKRASAPVQSLLLSEDDYPDAVEQAMLELWLVSPKNIDAFYNALSPEHFRSPLTRAVYEVCSHIVQLGKTPNFQNILTAFDEPAVKQYLIYLADSGEEKYQTQEAQFPARVVDVLAAFDKRDEERQRLSTLNRIKGAATAEEKNRQLLQLQQKLRKK